MELILGLTAIVDQLHGLMRNLSTLATSSRPDIDAQALVGLVAETRHFSFSQPS
jgi:hypothetical protein